GFFYFGILWLTVKHLPRVRRPALLFLGSFWGRLGITLIGFYLIMGGEGQRLLACLLGFLLVRSVLVRRFRPEPGRVTLSVK
ncbi:MAG: ATP synthase subunit I, partial [Deltaproteobacteria bacterium]|nr:ATP synthase subunit I [Deltaproteobacteria bacterium]